ncbi:MAG: hypothetical protein ACLFPL_01980 [Candidatus Nanoarchaeia archaeon]
MSNDKTPLTDPQTFTYEGVFDPDYVYSAMKDFLEQSKNYDGSEKKVEEKRIGGELHMECDFDADMHMTDHIHFKIETEFKMSGKDALVVDRNGAEHPCIEGIAEMKICSFIIINDNNHRHKNFFVEFFSKVYDKYFNTSEMGMLSKKARKDVSETITRFKQLTNMGSQRD